MDTNIYFILKVGDHLVARDSFLEFKPEPGQHFLASGFTFVCKNNEKAPENIVFAELYVQHLNVSDERFSEKIEATHHILVNEKDWETLPEGELKNIASALFQRVSLEFESSE